MKFLLRFWAGFAGVILIAWGSIKLIEAKFTNGDGIINNVNIDVLFHYLIGFFGLFAICTLGMKSANRLISNISTSLFSLLFFWLVGELICLSLIQFRLVDARKPFHSRLLLTEHWFVPRRPFWGDVSDVFGRWRYPNDSTVSVPVHKRPIPIRSNSFGMRDRERTLENGSSQKRAVLIGDSFVEGYIVEEHQRYSNILEKETGAEHLNFGINGTSVINYSLIYKDLVKKFDHDVVLVSLLPANDFEDYEGRPDQIIGLLKYPIYRPYWKGSHPNVQLAHSLADLSHSMATKDNYNYPVHTQQIVDSVYHTLPLGQKIIAEFSLNSYILSCALHLGEVMASKKSQPVNSYANAFFKHRMFAFMYSLEQIARESKGKKVMVYCVPIIGDLQAYQKQKTDDLSPHIEELCQKYGMTYIDLLPLIHAQGESRWRRFYQVNDGHWTPEGEAFIAKLLLNHPAYRQAMNLPLR